MVFVVQGLCRGDVTNGRLGLVVVVSTFLEYHSTSIVQLVL